MSLYPKLFSMRKATLFILLLLCAQACTEPDERPSIPKPAPKITTSTVTFIAVGDIMLSRGVARKILSAKDPLLPFSKFAERLRSTDFNFANLESPFSGSDHISPGGSLVFNTPDANISGLLEYNFKVITLANNHAMDQGFKGLRYTRDFLREKNILTVGTGENLDQAWEPVIHKVKNVKIGFVGASYASVNDGGIARNDYVARIEDLEQLKLAINRLKESGTDLIVATMHAGVEDTFKIDKLQQEFAHAAIDYGANLVIGHHPHWIQPVEVYKDRFIFYSLGNFIFDQRNPNNKEGLALKVTVQKRKTDDPTIAPVTRVKQVELIPVIIENFSTPREAGSEEAKKILQKIGISTRLLEAKVSREERVERKE